MLTFSTHNHIAFQQSPDREHRLVMRTASQSDDDTNPLEEKAIQPHVEESEQLPVNSEQSDEKENSVLRLSETQKGHILRNVSPALLNNATVGVLHTMDSLRQMVGDKEFKRLAKKRGINLQQAGDLDVIFRDLCTYENGAELLLQADSRMIGKLIAGLQTEVRQFARLERDAAEQFEGSSAASVLTKGRIKQIQAQLETRNPPQSLEEWLMNAGDHDLGDVLGMDITDGSLDAGSTEALRERIRNIDREMHHDDLWGADAIMQNPALLAALESGTPLQQLQRSLGEELRDNMLPTLGQLLVTLIHERANEARTWIDRQKSWYKAQRDACTEPNNFITLDREFLANPEIGVSASAIEREIGKMNKSIQLAERDHNPLNPVFLAQAADLEDQLVQYTQLGNKPGAICKPLRTYQEHTERWARALSDGTLNDVLEKHGDAAKREEIEEKLQNPGLFTALEQLQEDLTATDEDERGRVNSYNYPPQLQNQITVYLTCLQEDDVIDIADRHEDEAEKQPLGISHVIRTAIGIEANVLQEIQESRARLQSAVGQLINIPLLNTSAMNDMSLRTQVIQREGTLDHYLQQLERGMNDSIRIDDINIEIAKIENTARRIRELDAGQHITYFTDDNGRNRNGYYSYSDRTIYLRRGDDVDVRQMEIIKKHEQFHAVMDALTRGVGNGAHEGAIFPFLLTTRLKAVDERTDGVFSTELLKKVEKWGLTQEREKIIRDVEDPQEAERLFREILMEEALAQKMEYELKRDSGLFDVQELEDEFGDDFDVFQMIESTEFNEIQDPDPIVSEKFNTRSQIVDLDMPDFFGLGGEGDEDETDTKAKNLRNVTIELEGIQQDIVRLQQFAEAHPEYSGNLNPRLEALQKGRDIVDEVFRDSNYREKVPFPEEDDNFLKQLDRVKNESKDLIVQMDKVEVELRDLSEAQPEGYGVLKGIWQNTHFLSLIDLYLMGKDVVDNVTRIYLRNSAQNRSEVGAGFFSLFTDMQNIPGIGKYIGRMESEFEKTKEDKENEEVDLWKNSYKTKDAFEIMDIIKGTSNKDQIKGLLQLLGEKGRLDWGDEIIWDALNRLSIFQMPKGPCRRDVLLRDSWLKKIITQIWDDKDFYLELKGNNDSKFQSEKDKYEDLVHTYANTGSMGKVLKQQLEIFVRYRKNNQTPPAEVNPHIYEKVIEYAMVNGKMSMEEKFFYLIQGIRYGMLPLERLTILNAKVLQNFPFIDYFTSHNNSMPEMIQLGRQLQETEDPFKPGTKTTLFLQFQLAKDEDARQRVIKIIDRDARNIDHEDVPTMATFLDYGNWESLLQPASGQLQRLTKEGLKNAYVGFSDIFQSYSHLAKLDEKGIRKFTKEDAYTMAQKIASYVHFDNVVTEKANKTGSMNHPSLTWHQINGESMPLGQSGTPKSFRDKLNIFIKGVATDYDIKEVTVGMKKDEKEEGKTVPKTVKMTDYIPGQMSDNKKYEGDIRKELYAATKEFVKQLSDKIYENPSVFISRIKGTEFKSDISEEKVFEAMKRNK